MTHWICVTCGAQFEASERPPGRCPICEDPRQYVPVDGQRWTTMAQLRESHANRVAAEGELIGVGTEPKFAIGQRALLVPFGERNLLWDCVTLIDDATVAAIEARGGLGGIAISHPHYYSGMVEWARRFGCPIWLHADDARWIMRSGDAVELWDGDVKELGHGLTLLRLGGHFDGGTVLRWEAGAQGRGALLSGDIVQVIPDRGHVSFMYSYPNLVPLPGATVTRMARVLEGFPFEHIYGAWWGFVIDANGREVVRRSAERYVAALAGDLP